MKDEQVSRIGCVRWVIVGAFVILAIWLGLFAPIYPA